MELTGEQSLQLRKILASVSFLEKLSPAELDALVNAMHTRPFRGGEKIIQQGEPADAFYIIASGTVKVLRKSFFMSRQIRTQEAGTYFGELALIKNIPRTATVTGEKDGACYVLSRQAFDDVLLHNPGIRILIMGTAVQRVQADWVRDPKS